MSDLTALVYPKRGEVFIATEGSMKGFYFDEVVLASANLRPCKDAVSTFPDSQRPLMFASCRSELEIMNPGWLAYMKKNAPASCGHYVSREAAIELGYTDGTFPLPPAIPETMVFYATEGPMIGSFFIIPREYPDLHGSENEFAGQRILVKGEVNGFDPQVLDPAWMDYSHVRPSDCPKHRGGWIPLSKAIELKLTDATTKPK
ncbi:MAG: hypothetical protein WC802_00645 [Patescibacteria group bacterium]|jgi:hypothetical protein